MKQLDMFDKPERKTQRAISLTESAPYQPHSETSKAAAVRIEPSLKTMQGKVLAYLRFHGPLTDEEMQDGLGMNPSTQRPRRIELVRDGFARKYSFGGGKCTRPTKSGGWAQLWEAV